MVRSSPGVVVRVLVVVIGSVIGSLLAPMRAEACWRPPVDAVVVDPFRRPACRWCPGNRGLEYDTEPGQPVVAVDTGRVTFAGEVAGVKYLVTELGDGRLVTYGRLADMRHSTGDVVMRGQTVGTTLHGFHFGVRVDGDYADPARWIGRLVGRPRLVPNDGSAAGPAPPPRLRCAAAGEAPRRSVDPGEPAERSPRRSGSLSVR